LESGQQTHLEDSPIVDFPEVVRRRRMVRSFATTPVDPAVVDRIVLQALRSPTAGNAGGTAWVVLESPAQTRLYFDATTDESWRSEHPQWYAGLSRAPVVLLAYASSERYVDRYGEPDKAGSGLGDGPEHWPVPYWTGDAAFGVMAALLGAVDAGLGACIVGAFRGEVELARVLGVPAGWQLFCAVVLGHPDGHDRPSPSLDRPLPPLSTRLHRGRW
jgi:nitroreductase